MRRVGDDGYTMMGRQKNRPITTGHSTVQLKAAISCFFSEFSKFETQFVGMALRSLSKDSFFAEQAEKLLDFEARLKLLERMACARGVSPSVLAELGAQLSRARMLHEQLQAVARNLAAGDEDDIKPYRGGVGGRAKPAQPRSADYARLAELNRSWMPDVGKIQKYTTEAIELQEALHAISDNFDQHLTVLSAVR
jgi:hypothetical protein